MIFLTADHGGWVVQQRLVKWLQGLGYAVTDLHPKKPATTDDYPLAAKSLVRRLHTQRTSKGIAVCRSGVGMALVANKYSGIRAAQVFNVRMAKKSRTDEDSNVLSVAADYQTWPEIQRIVIAWLTTAYRPTKRFQRRLREISSIERHGR